MTIALHGGGVKSFSYAEDILNDLEVSFSPERMRTYLNAAGGDREKAFHLYAWNTATSAAFYGPLQGLEVALRNAIYRQLAGCYGAAWYDNPAAGLDAGCLERIANAKKEVARAGHAVGPPRIVAALSFGFWISLLGSGGRINLAGHRADYEKTLWRPALRGAFPHHVAPLKRKQAHGPLDYLRTFRNRIAHQEPIFGRHLSRDHQRILDVTGWISPMVRTWIEGHSRVPMLLDASNYATDVYF